MSFFKDSFVGVRFIHCSVKLVKTSWTPNCFNMDWPEVAKSRTFSLRSYRTGSTSTSWTQTLDVSDSCTCKHKWNRSGWWALSVHWWSGAWTTKITWHVKNKQWKIGRRDGIIWISVSEPDRSASRFKDLCWILFPVTCCIFLQSWHFWCAETHGIKYREQVFGCGVVLQNPLCVF